MRTSKRPKIKLKSMSSNSRKAKTLIQRINLKFLNKTYSWLLQKLGPVPSSLHIAKSMKNVKGARNGLDISIPETLIFRKGKL